MNCYKCGQNIPEYSLVCPNCGAEMSRNARMHRQAWNINMNMNFPPFGRPSMMWYNLLILFYLFMEAFISLSSGIQYILGYMPEFLKNLNEIMYYGQVMRGLKFIDIIYGVWLILVAVFAVVTRMKLAKFKKNAPLFVVLFFTLPTLVNCGYTIGLLVIIKAKAAAYFSLVYQIVIQAIFVYANYIYFKKRKTLFVN